MVNTDILVAGETLCDFFPVDEDGLRGQTFLRRPGGAPANVAVALGKLDCNPAVWSAVGRDQFGDDLVGTLQRAGCQTQLIERSAQPTTLAMVDRSNDDFLFYRGADTTLSPDNLPESAVAAASWLVIGGVSLSSTPARVAIISLLDQANQSGCSVFFDPNYRRELWEDFDFIETVRTVLPRVAVLSVTESELQRIAPRETTAEERIASILDQGPHTVCITAGDEGARLISSKKAPWGKKAVRHPGFTVQTVDTVGAGDAFNAGILWSLSTGTMIPERLLAAGNAVAALSTTDLGAMNGLPTPSEVMAFLDDQP